MSIGRAERERDRQIDRERETEEQRGGGAAPNDAIEVHRPPARETERVRERADRTFVRYCYSAGGTHPAQRE